MDLKVVSGKTIRLPAEFFEGDEPTDPASPRVTIVDPNKVIKVSDGVPLRERQGIYRYDYPVPVDGPTGNWEAIWTASIGGASVSASDIFEVQPAPAATLPKPVEAQKPPAAKPVESPKPPTPRPVVPPAPAAGRPAETPRPPAAGKPGEPTARPPAGRSGEPTARPPAGRSGEPTSRPAAAGRPSEPPRPPATKPGEARRPDAKPAARPDGASADRAPAEETVSTKAGLGKRKEPAKGLAWSREEAGREKRLEEEDSADGRTKSGRSETPGSKAKLSRGKAFLIVGAIAVILAAIWFSPRRNDTVQAKIDQGVAAQKAGRADEAKRLYEEVLSNDPDNKLANFNLGVASQLENRVEEAEAYYRKSLEADPVFLPAMFNLAILLEGLNRNDESAEMYRRIIEEYPDDGAVHLNYGFLLLKMDRPDEGREEFRRAVEIDPAFATRIPSEFRPAPAPPPEP
ncbi:MAG TPA: tetratricopeptide repeat protein [Actinomycetota bacterium]|nr:tetratricopeptide repeat protein [Actinomycetota bacterium]